MSRSSEHMPRLMRNPGGSGATEERNGFTLLEVLIAVAIMAGIVTVLYASFFTSGRNVEQAEIIRDSSDMARTLIQKVSSDITNAYWNPRMNRPAVITVLNGKKEEAQIKDAVSRHDSITVTTLTNSRRFGSRETELWEVGYYFKQKADGSGYVMMRREKRELSKDTPAGEGGVEYEITDKVQSFQLRYSPAGAFAWQDEWNTTTRGALPQFVEVVFSLDSGMTYSTYVEVRNLPPQS